MIAEAFLIAALSLPALSSHNLTQADMSFFRFMGAMTSGHQDSILLIDAPYDNRDLMHGLWWLQPGGFLFVNGDFAYTLNYFRPRNWEMLPFMWRDYHIWRKPLDKSA